MRERQKKASVGMKMTDAKWRDFLNQWARYKRCSGVGGQDVVDDLVLCLSDYLRMEVTRELGESLDNIKEAVLVASRK